MTIRHDDLKVGDRVYAPEKAQIFLVEEIAPEFVLLKPEKNLHRENPRRLLEPINGLHWGLESFESYKQKSKLLDQLDSLPKSHWR
jgi:hypothetical protein